MLSIQRYQSISKLPSDCRALFHVGEQDSFDLSAEWFQLLGETVFPEKCTHIYLLQRDGELRGVLPLFFQRTRMWFRQLSGLTNYYSSLYRPLLASTVTPDELAGYLWMILKDARVDVLRFDTMDPTHPAFNLLELAIRRAGLKPYRFYCSGNWYLPVGSRSFPTYFQGLPSRICNTVRRREKKFYADARGKLEIVTGNEGLEKAIVAWNKIYSASWKKAEPFPEFVPGLIRLCAARGWLRLGLAYYDGEPVASQIWIVSHGRAAIYKLSYDEKFTHLSAGTVLTAHLMRHVLDIDKVEEVDYLIGDDAYKKDWMSHRRERWGIITCNTKTVRGVAGAATQMLSEMKRQFRIPEIIPAKKQDGQTMKWTIYPISKFEQHTVSWDALNECGSNSPLLSSRFLIPSLRSFQSGKEKLAILGNPRHPDAMCILKQHHNLIWDTFQPAQAPVGFWLMRPDLDLENALTGLMRALPGFPLVIGITQQDPWLIPRPPNSAKMLTLDYIDTARILIDGDYETYWDSRSKNLRQNMRKARNKLEKDGLEFQLKCISDPTEIKNAIESYGVMESTGWKAADGTAVQLNNIQGKFYTDLLETFCRAGCGRIYYLTFNDAIAAMDLCIHQGNTFIILKTSYDEAYRDYSPAMLLHQELFRVLFQSGDFHRIEFYGKVMDWHLRWTEEIRTMYHVNVYRWERIMRMMQQRIGTKNMKRDGKMP